MTSTILSSLLMFAMIVPAFLGSNMAREEQISASYQVGSHSSLVENFQPPAKRGGDGDDDPIVPPNRR